MPAPARYLLAFTDGMVRLDRLCRSLRLSRRWRDLDRGYAECPRRTVAAAHPSKIP